jgi:hypothetical protein
MDEADARNALLVRAWETQPHAPPHWSDEDRAWASRAAAEVEGEHATAGALVARRAALAVERLGGREPGLRRVLGAVTWRTWVGWAFAALALAAGVLSDAVGPGQRVNVLAPPLLAVIAWNLAVYVALAAHAAARLVRRPPRAPGLLARTLGQFAHARASGEAIGRAAPPGAAFLRDWTRASAPLTAARVARVLHVAAFALALGALGGLYLRGLVLEYRAGWESTFLRVEHVHALLRAVLGPASQLTGIPIADPLRLASIRFPGSAGENAAPWIHLYGVTVALVVLAPRLLLALASRWREVRLARRFPLSLDDPYFLALVRAMRGEVAVVRVLPYAVELTPQATLALHALLTKACGGNAQVEVATTTEFGGEDALRAPAQPGTPPTLVAALFASSATPEPEHHGAFVAAARASLPAAARLVVLIDESAFRSRFAATPGRIDERRAAWSRMLAFAGLEPVFVDLAASDASDAGRALAAALDRPATATMSA